MRQFVLLVVLLFIGLLIYLTASEIKRNGVTAGGILAIIVIVLFSIGIVGSLFRNPRE
jgi:predicted tellurium resistance membrane protein TerC